MDIANIEKVTDLLHGLRDQIQRLDMLRNCQGIHVQYGPRGDIQHMHFNYNEDIFDPAANLYPFEDMSKALESILKDRIKSCTDMLQHYGVEIDVPDHCK